MCILIFELGLTLSLTERSLVGLFDPGSLWQAVKPSNKWALASAHKSPRSLVIEEFGSSPFQVKMESIHLVIN
jgi:hypothetical protein